MTRTKTPFLIVGAATAALALSGCSENTEAQNQIEAQAEAIDESYEAEADLQEALAAGGPNEETAGEYADSLREQGEEAEQHLNEMAEELDDVPSRAEP